MNTRLISERFVRFGHDEPRIHSPTSDYATQPAASRDHRLDGAVDGRCGGVALPGLVQGKALPKPKAVIYPVFSRAGPFAARHVRHETARPVGVQRRIQSDLHEHSRHPNLRAFARCWLQRGHLWSLVRSLTHKESGHDKGTYVMLTGSSVVPPSFRSSKPQSDDLPSIAAIAGYSTQRRGILPSSVILPEKIYHSNTGVYSGQFAGLLGPQHEPWMIECTDKPHAYHSYSGAFPKYLFNLHKGEPADKVNLEIRGSPLVAARGGSGFEISESADALEVDRSAA